MKIFLKDQKQFEKKFKIKFLKPVCELHSNGFISVILGWTNLECKEFSKFKYPKLSHYCYGGEERYSKKKYSIIQSVSFEFDLSKEDSLGLLPPWFSIVLGAENQQDEQENEFKYIFFENTKYGLVCWFAPREWEDWTNTKILN